MDDFFWSGRVADLVLAVLLAESVILAARHSRKGFGRRLLSFLLAGLPGAFLVLALRFSLVRANWQWIAGWLGLAFFAHVLDLWKRPPGEPYGSQRL